MDELRAIRYFLKVAETGSFTEAAKHFSVPPSSLSRRVADLEAHLQTSLLHRTTRVVKLTETGKQYYQQAQTVVGQLEDATESVRSHNREPQGLLRISSMVSFGESRLLPLLDEFNSLHARITLDVTLSDELAAFSQDQADIAIRGGFAPNERVVAIQLLSNQFYPVVAPAYLKKYGVPVHVEDLKQHRGLYFRAPTGALPWLVLDENQWINVSAPAVAVSNNGPWLLNKVLAGEGIIMAPRWFSAPYIENGELVELAFDRQLSVRPGADPGSIFLLYQKQRYQLAKIKAAVDFLVARIRE